MSKPPGHRHNTVTTSSADLERMANALETIAKRMRAGELVHRSGGCIIGPVPGGVYLNIDMELTEGPGRATVH